MPVFVDAARRWQRQLSKLSHPQSSVYFYPYFLCDLLSRLPQVDDVAERTRTRSVATDLVENEPAPTNKLCERPCAQRRSGLNGVLLEPPTSSLAARRLRDLDVLRGDQGGRDVDQYPDSDYQLVRSLIDRIWRLVSTNDVARASTRLAKIVLSVRENPLQSVDLSPEGPNALCLLPTEVDSNCAVSTRNLRRVWGRGWVHNHLSPREPSCDLGPYPSTVRVQAPVAGGESKVVETRRVEGGHESTYSA